MKSIFVVVFLKLAADPDALTKAVAAWALAVLVIAVIVGSTYHGLRFLARWILYEREREDRLDSEAAISEGIARTETTTDRSK